MSGKDGKVGKDGKEGSRRSVGQFASLLFGACLAVFPVLPVLPVSAQTDPRLVDAIRLAQEGRGDSARTKVRRLLAATAPTDTVYPQIIYTQAMVASDANEMRRQLQRVAVEYSSSSWADDALLRLVQLDYASGNLEGAARNLERIRLDYPGSHLLPQASYWAARTYFDQKTPELACRWITEGLAESRGNVELQNQLGYLDQRCAGIRTELAARAPADSQRVPAAGGTDTAALPSARTDSIPSPLTNATPVAPTPARPDTTAATPRPEPAAPAPAPAPPRTETPPVATRPAGIGRFRVQITAVRVRRTAGAMAERLKQQGLSPVVVEEGGLYKVRVGDYATKPEAVAALPGLKAKLGGSPFVVAEP